ncbi:1-deoxy-D-xylulose-5-phosphate reductoisomerase [Francisella philomiragia]|uniref:1-deoxy-D-xylulose 5-phosphate reductoisomerase n=1 Tax=Francisella philomiragia subsp. philomiragia (strain ATCC 25017 / CCUG 19701 / FSC 153 / O\|nr:1-deoxy-D-xylulose-5-phosphate reductoisomerase [Francisella philomiragia]AJI47589.1 1-deoxy-D-xylulose 5-phosphate reductoisomerase [Francisella philomiragia]AJI49462.1 1-deoxy-D-xylulose 5-phosphate reductoisomerase [Francisella philomiragia]MBK2020659.1 1-deoxy-D-xylulose-5-phosphate reductoisomerase [Francisella philomiragia]MBK2030922.1 1-deoxy-D-xylulose-5-phosphate reductoisomerase [Francisella philomiragia]MBK2263420.1 1-deoxy-D-xylulose-5-phosphate reductoisomerase [Francisella phi
MLKKTITILGATGSIGDSTLAVIRESNDFEVYALSAFSNVEKLAKLCKEFSPKFAVVPDLVKKQQLQTLVSDVTVLVGEDALEEVSSASEVDIVMSAIVGIAGLKPTFAAARAGKKILLANKESLVTAGHLLIEEVEKNNAQLIPVDSEHNAIFQCIDNSSKKYTKEIDEIVLTASGGPFRDKELSELIDVTPAQACAHPNWQMGRKISVDSSTMVNKALEVIEAYWLFSVSADKIGVLIHPQSVIHSMVKYVDGSYIAQLGVPDMRTPIANSMYYPNRGSVSVDRLDFTKYELTFREACFERFEALKIVFDNLSNKNYAANIVFNAANEVLVAAFLNEKIKYLDIIEVNKKVTKELIFENPASIEEVFEIDKKTREYVDSILG